MALRIIENYLPKLEAVFGKYPLNHLYFVAVPFLKDGVMENWSMINVIAPNLLINDGNYQSNYNNNNNNNNNNNQPETYQLTELIVHELVHQWIGNWVSFDIGVVYGLMKHLPLGQHGRLSAQILPRP